MSKVTPQNHRHLRDASGSTITEGVCVLDVDREVGHVRLGLWPGISGPGSAYWHGWFNFVRTRNEQPFRGKAMKGDLVQILRGGNP